jgi:hypothetical protein
VGTVLGLAAAVPPQVSAHVVVWRGAVSVRQVLSQVEGEMSNRWPPKLTFRRIEDKFRVWCFHTYYDRAFADVNDCTLRFALAIVASSRYVSEKAIMHWLARIKNVQKEQAVIYAHRTKGRPRADEYEDID